ncbi:MAG: phosphodiester glycosidase family protein [Bacteroidales bacterium]|nr:phosphodiester glycosidase family protein [Bacteroidales bacterium]
MRKILLFIAGLVFLFTGCKTTPKTNPVLEQFTDIMDLETGKVLSAQEATAANGICGEWHPQLFDSQQSIAYVRINPEAYELNIFCGEGEQADSTSALCMRNSAVAGINGSYFNVQELTHTTYVKDDRAEVGETLPSEVFRTNGVFLSGEDGYEIDAADTVAVLQAGEKSWEAMASGPILIDDGKPIVYEEGIQGWEKFYNRRHPRTMVGKDAEGYLWLVAVDGRFDEGVGMTIAEMTELAQMLDLTDALNLDGGGSTTLWTLEKGVMNHPYDNKRYDHEGQRVVPNVIGVVKK